MIIGIQYLELNFIYNLQLADETDITTLNLQWYRSQIGIVAQEPVLFDLSIGQNIAYGDNARHVPMNEVITAARSANIHSFIDTLPNVRYQLNFLSRKDI